MLLSAIISIVIVVFILMFTVDSNTFQYLSQTKIKYEFFLVAVLLSILAWFIWGARISILSRTLDSRHPVTVFCSTKIVLANLFLAGITPSMVGGEPVRIYLLKKEGLNLGCATAVVLSERFIDAVFILLCIPFAFFIFQDKIQLNIIRVGILVGIIVFLLLIFLFIYAVRNPEKTKSFLIQLEKKIFRILRKQDTTEQTKIVKTISQEVDNFHTSMNLFVSHRKKTLVAVGLLTVLYWCTGFMIPSLLLVGLGLPPMIVESFAAQMILLIIVMLPITPGSSGLTEGGMAALYGMILGSNYSYVLGVFVILFRFISYHMQVIVGAVFQYKIFRSFTSVSLESEENTKT
ncbi:MAG: flippase-like domain-containing protein [Candidatus Thermoplasmatota archaeon]